MVRQVLDEFRKLKRSWILILLPFLSLLAPLLGVLTARANATNDPERLKFDFATIFTQVQFDNTVLVAPLVLGTLAIYLLQREYQEATLGPLLCMPTKRSRLLLAKVWALALVGLVGALVSAGATVAMALAAGSPEWEGNVIVEGGARLVWGQLLVIPSAAFLMALVVVFRNYLVAVALSFVTILLGMVAINLPEQSYFVPWLAPALLSVDAKAIESLGLEPAQLSKAVATYVLFAAAAFIFLFMAPSSQTEG